MQFQVPQFIEIEEKIIGPFTFQQAAYLAGAGGVTVVAFLMLKSIFLVFLVAGPFIALAIALAFVKVNEKPFIEYLEAGFWYFFRGRLYLWRERRGIETPKPAAPAPVAPKPITRTSDGRDLRLARLKALATKLDTENA